MFNTSQDLLYIVLSLCIVWFTVFLCWLLYQAARTLKNANKIIENVSNKLELISDAVTFMKGKVDHLSSGMGMVSGMITTLVEKFVVNKLSSTLEKRSAEKRRAKRRDVADETDTENES